MSVVIHHNPDCGTSRNVLAIIEAAGFQPTVIEYLKEGWTLPQLQGLFAAASLTPRTALRTTRSPAAELGLLLESVSDEAILRGDARAPRSGQPAHRLHAEGCKAVPPERNRTRPAGPLAAWPVCREDGALLIDAANRRMA